MPIITPWMKPLCLVIQISCCRCPKDTNTMDALLALILRIKKSSFCAVTCRKGKGSIPAICKLGNCRAKLTWIRFKISLWDPTKNTLRFCCDASSHSVKKVSIPPIRFWWRTPRSFSIHTKGQSSGVTRSASRSTDLNAGFLWASINICVFAMHTDLLEPSWAHSSIMLIKSSNGNVVSGDPMMSIWGRGNVDKVRIPQNSQGHRMRPSFKWLNLGIHPWYIAGVSAIYQVETFSLSLICIGFQECRSPLESKTIRIKLPRT